MDIVTISRLVKNRGPPCAILVESPVHREVSHKAANEVNCLGKVLHFMVTIVHGMEAARHVHRIHLCLAHSRSMHCELIRGHAGDLAKVGSGRQWIVVGSNQHNINATLKRDLVGLDIECGHSIPRRVRLCLFHVAQIEGACHPALVGAHTVSCARLSRNNLIRDCSMTRERLDIPSGQDTLENVDLVNEAAEEVLTLASGVQTSTECQLVIRERS